MKQWPFHSFLVAVFSDILDTLLSLELRQKLSLLLKLMEEQVMRKEELLQTRRLCFQSVFSGFKWP